MGYHQVFIVLVIHFGVLDQDVTIGAIRIIQALKVGSIVFKLNFFALKVVLVFRGYIFDKFAHILESLLLFQLRIFFVYFTDWIFFEWFSFTFRASNILAYVSLTLYE